MTATKTKSKKETVSNPRRNRLTETQAVADITDLLDFARSFTTEIQNIMTSSIPTGEKASTLGTATKHFAEYLDTVEQNYV